MDEAVEERAGGNDDGFGADLLLEGGGDARRPAVFDDDGVGNGLADGEILLVFQHAFHPQPVAQPVRLCTRGTHCRALAGIEPSKLYGGGVYVFGHLAAQGVDFPYKVSFGKTADGGIAGHGTDGIGVDYGDQRSAAHAGAGQRRFTAGMSGTYDNDIVFVHLGTAAAVSLGDLPWYGSGGSITGDAGGI